MRTLVEEGVASVGESMRRIQVAVCLVITLSWTGLAWCQWGKQTQREVLWAIKSRC